jgi:XTP/dITP diphosphohydrolase
MKIVLATNNKHKIKEIKDILADLEVDILTLKDFHHAPQVEETGKTLEENAVIKAKTICEFTGLPSMADDSGLEVNELDGAPGVMSARFAGEHCSFKDNNLKLLSLMQDVPQERRDARFVCVVALAKNLTQTITVKGEVKGSITFQEMGASGFGYDPVFWLPGLKKTFAQLTLEEKNKISHRAKAFGKAKDLIQRGFLNA